MDTGGRAAPGFTEHECLKAYREGRFYGCLKDSGLTIQDFTATESSIFVTTDRAATIRFISEEGIAEEIGGASATYALLQRNGGADLVYARVEVEEDSGEHLFLQPVMYRPRA